MVAAREERRGVDGYGDDYRIRVSSVESITRPLLSEVEEGLEGG